MKISLCKCVALTAINRQIFLVIVPRPGIRPPMYIKGKGKERRHHQSPSPSPYVLQSTHLKHEESKRGMSGLTSLTASSRSARSWYSTQSAPVFWATCISFVRRKCVTYVLYVSSLCFARVDRRPCLLSQSDYSPTSS